MLDYERKGDYGGFEHKTYHDRASSYFGIYEKTMQFFDELHQAFPELLIDCTYEVWGEYYINDFALLEHADYDWLTNYEADPPEGSRQHPADGIRPGKGHSGCHQPDRQPANSAGKPH